MGNLNRTNDLTEQLEVLQSSFIGSSGAIVPGTTLQGCLVPSAGTLNRVLITCQGASVIPTSSVQIVRFIPGAGVTTITGAGASFGIPQMGISGVLSVSLVSIGSTLLNLLPNDMIQVILGVNSANAVNLSVVYRKTQDIVSRFGSSGV